MNEQLKIIAAAGAAEDAFQKGHGGTGDVGAAVTKIEMLAMSDLSPDGQGRGLVGLFGGRSRTWVPNATTRPTSARSSRWTCWVASR